MIDPGNKERLKRYAQLKAEQKRIAKSIAEEGPEILVLLEAMNVDKIQSDFGIFYMTSKKTYKYSKRVEELKAREKADGTAKVEVSQQLNFRAPSEKQ